MIGPNFGTKCIQYNLNLLVLQLLKKSGHRNILFCAYELCAPSYVLVFCIHIFDIVF